jgi:hypothetical protein
LVGFGGQPPEGQSLAGTHDDSFGQTGHFLWLRRVRTWKWNERTPQPDTCFGKSMSTGSSQRIDTPPNRLAQITCPLLIRLSSFFNGELCVDKLEVSLGVLTLNAQGTTTIIAAFLIVLLLESVRLRK